MYKCYCYFGKVYQFKSSIHYIKDKKVSITLGSIEIILLDGEYQNSTYTTYKGLVHGKKHTNPVNDDLILNDDVLLLPYTTGTTGVPKGVMITSKNLKAHIFQIGRRIADSRSKGNAKSVATIVQLIGR